MYIVLYHLKILWLHFFFFFHIRLFRSIDDVSNELVMWVNAEPKVIIAECKGEEFILPPYSSFIINDACASRVLIKREFIYRRAIYLILVKVFSS